MPDLLARLLVGVLPVLLFLLALIYLDSYKLVRLRWVLAAIGFGAVTAGLGYLVNLALIDFSGLSLKHYSRYVAPVIEELLKAALLVQLIRSQRIGFLVDAAIFGFAVGSGFALVENLYYLRYLPDAELGTWLVRGFGTAIMHGGTTAIFGMLAKSLSERERVPNRLAYVAALPIPIVVHSAFNHFFLSPLLSAALVVLGLPPLILLVFRRSEQALESWLDVGFDADTELLELLESGELSASRIGRYLQSLKEQFRGEVVADMLCYLRIHVELSLRAKGYLLMRERGFRPEIDEETRAKFVELRYLEGSIGRTGRLAMAPFFHFSGKELWQLYMLGK